MGKKHNKERYFIVNYNIKPDGKFDEVVELSKKTVGSGKFSKATVILDCVNEEVIKNILPMKEKVDIPYKNMIKHYRKWYADVIDEFINS